MADHKKGEATTIRTTQRVRVEETAPQPERAYCANRRSVQLFALFEAKDNLVRREPIGA